MSATTSISRLRGPGTSRVAESWERPGEWDFEIALNETPDEMWIKVWRGYRDPPVREPLEPIEYGRSDEQEPVLRFTAPRTMLSRYISAIDVLLPKVNAARAELEQHFEEVRERDRAKALEQSEALGRERDQIQSELDQL